jgi:hypothetical protein
LVDPGDLAKAVRLLLADPHRWLTLARQAEEHAVRHYQLGEYIGWLDGALQEAHLRRRARAG